jgi:hypothetical protein
MSDKQKFATDYIDVAARLVEFREKHPEGSLQPARPDKPFEVIEVAGTTYIVYGAAAYRTPDDPRPGIGYAYEQVPGRTPYTRNSELQNAETSAWGRAIVAALAADTKKGIASAEEVRNRQAERDQPEPTTDPEWLKQAEDAIAEADSMERLEGIKQRIRATYLEGKLEQVHSDHLLVLWQKRGGELAQSGAAA